MMAEAKWNFQMLGVTADCLHAATSKKISGELIVACRDSTKVLEFIEEALDEFALATESKITRQWNRAAGVGRMMGVICLIAQLSLRFGQRGRNGANGFTGAMPRRPPISRS
jgi:hypothetical protein